MADDALIVSTIEVDVETGKAQLRDFAAAADRTAKQADTSAKQINASFKNATSGGIMSASERAAFLKPIDDVHKELLAKIRGVGATTSSVGAEVGVASRGMALSLGMVATAATAVASGIALVGFAINEFADAADPVTNLSRGFQTLTERIGENADVMLGKSKAATMGLVTDLELMRLTNEAIILQLPVTADKMAELARISTELGRAMGVEPTKALESIILGIGRESNRLLDNIGILVDTKKAHEDYAAALGKDASELTEVEKRIGFMNATLDAARFRVQELGGETTTLSEYWNTLGVATTNVKNKTLDTVNVIGGQMVTALLSSSAAVQTLHAAIEFMSDSVGPNLAELEQRFLGIQKAAEDPGGLKLFDDLEKIEQPVTKSIERLGALRTEAAHLKSTMGARTDPEYLTVVKLRLQQISDEIDKILGKQKEFKGFTGSLDSKLPFPSRDPNAPFGGGDPFGGREPGTFPDPRVHGDMFGEEAATARLEFESNIEKQLLQIRRSAAEEWSQEALNLDNALLERRYAAAIQNAIDQKADVGAVIRNFQEEQNNLEAEYSEGRKSIFEQETQARLNQSALVLNAIGGAVSAVFGKSKAGAIAGAVINTAAAVTQALANIPPPASYAVAAASAAMGLAQIRKIQSTSVGSGAGGGASASTAAPSVDYSNAVRTPGGAPGNATGTTPVIAGADTRATAEMAGGTKVDVTINAVDAHSIQRMMQDPANRRAFGDGINQYNARR